MLHLPIPCLFTETQEAQPKIRAMDVPAGHSAEDAHCNSYFNTLTHITHVYISINMYVLCICDIFTYIIYLCI